MSLAKLPPLTPNPMKPVPPQEKTRVAASSLTLNLEAQKPDPAKKRWRIVCYGAKGLGKSTFSAQIPGHFFIDCEDGLQEITARKHRCSRWEDVLQVVDAICSPQGATIEWVILDTIISAYKMAADFYCRLKNVAHQSLIGSMGIGWSLVANEIERVILRLYSHGKGVVINAHPEIMEMDFGGITLKKTQAALGPGEVARAIRRHVDAILYFDRKRFDSDRVEHLVYLKGTDSFEAMVRSSSPQSLPSFIPFRGPEDQVWSAFQAAVNQRKESPDAK